MKNVQKQASVSAFSQGQLMNSNAVVSEEDLPQYEASMREFKEDALRLYANAGDMLTTG